MRRVAYRLYKLGGWFTISLALLLIMLRGVGTWFAPDETQLIGWAKDHFPYGLAVKSAKMEFIGWDPAITLHHVDVLTEDNRLALNIEKVKVVFNIYSLLFQKIELRDLILEGMKVGVAYQTDGSVIITDLSSLKWDPRASSSKKLPLQHLLIKNSDIHVSLGSGKSIPLAQVDVRMDSNFQHRISGSAIVVNDVHSTLDFFIDFPLFGENGAQGFCQWKGGSVTQLRTLFGKKPSTESSDGKLDLNAWLSIDRQGEKHLFAELHLSDNPTPYEFIANTYPCAQGTCLEAQTWNIDIESSLQVVKSLGILPEGLSHKLDRMTLQGQLDTLSLCYEPSETKMLIEGKTLDIDYREGFEQSIKINNPKLLLFLTTGERYLQGTLLNATVEGVPFSGDFSMKLGDQAVKDLEFSVEAYDWPIKHTLNLLPRKVMDQTLVHWLDNALVDGKIAQASFVFRGDPKDFPFDKNQGLFEANLILDKVGLDYDKGNWPALSQLDGTLLFQNRKMEVDVSKAVLDQGELVSAKATIPDLGAPVAMLSVKAKVKNQLDRAASIVQKSPLKNTVGKSLAALDFQGNMELDLGLLIPLSTKSAEHVKVSGLLSVLEGSVLIPDWGLQANQLIGEVTFTENSVNSNTLKGTMLGNKVDFNLSTQEHKPEQESEGETEFQIQARGSVEYSRIQQWLNLAPSDIVKGQTEYLANVSVYSNLEKHPLHVDIAAPLTALEIHLPAPLGKALETTRPSSLSLDLEPNKAAHFRVKYGSEADLALVMDLKNDQWQFKGAHLNFGNKAETQFRSDGVFLVEGELETLDAQAWKSLLQGNASTALPFEPKMALMIDKFILNDDVFIKTKVESNWDKTQSLWNFNFDGPSIKGRVVLPEGEDKREITIDLAKLTLTTDDEKPSSWLDVKTVLPRPIEVKIKKLKLNKKTFNDFQARIEPSWKGYDFPRIQAKMKGTEIQLSGQWDAFSHTKQVTAEGKIITRNSSDTFKAMGMTGTVQQAKGNIDFSLSWQGSPSKMDFPTLLGKAEFQLSNGYVQGINPGIGRVLNLLSLDSVQRRLNFDFRDVTQNGFVFDEFTAKFQFGKGKVSTNKLSLRGPSANIEAYGQVNLENQEINGGIIVMPNVTGSLPVAAAIAAGNPAIGAAVWVVDKMVGKKLQEIHRYRYRLVGTWDAPKLEELSTVPIRRS